MSQAQINGTATLAGLTIPFSATRSAEGSIGQEVALAAGKAGTLSTRTDNDTGVVTLESGHGITISDLVDVFWTGGSRYGMTVSAAGATTLDLDGGAGDNLPAEDAAIVVAAQQTVDMDVSGDLVEALAVSADRRCSVHFQQANGTGILHLDTPANELWNWLADQGIANPLASATVGQLKVSCGEATAGTLKIGCLYDSAA